MKVFHPSLVHVSVSDFQCFLWTYIYINCHTIYILKDYLYSFIVFFFLFAKPNEEKKRNLKDDISMESYVVASTVKTECIVLELHSPATLGTWY